MRPYLRLTVALTGLAGVLCAAEPPAFAAHCGRCHPLPDPGLLPAEDWPATVGWMGAYLGHPPGDQRVAGAVAGALVPPSALVSSAELRAIATWLAAGAASRAEVRATRPKLTVAPLVAEASPLDPGPGQLTTLLWSGGGLSAAGFGPEPGLRLAERDTGALLLASPMPSEPVGCELHPDGNLRLSLLGHWAGDAAAGMVLDLGFGHDGQIHAAPVVNDYHRLAGHLSTDLDGDGALDLVLLGFGDTPLGRLAVLWGGAQPSEQILFEGSGTVSAVALDVDDDGRMDLVAAIAQEHCRLLWFRQTAPRVFETITLVQRPVGWGLNQILAADLNGDGRAELIEVAGNNMELPEPPLKAHHGLRILALAVDGSLDQRAFIPLFGATRCAIGDVDGDGRLDLVATAFHPDWDAELPVTALIARSSADGGWTSQRLSAAHWNRWLTVAVEAGPGPARILLGGGAIPTAMPATAQQRWLPAMRSAPSVLSLRWADAEHGE